MSTDILFLGSHSPYFLKNGLDLFKEKAIKMIPKYGRWKLLWWGAKKVKGKSFMYGAE